jgi:hypothetical protein
MRTARELAFRNLETRGRSPEEIAARQEYLDLLALPRATVSRGGFTSSAGASGAKRFSPSLV